MEISANPDLSRQIFYDGVFKPEECEKIISLFGHSSSSKVIEKNEANQWILDRLFKVAGHANNKYYRFNISYLENLYINLQNEETIPGWKMDLCNNHLTRKISIITFLSDKNSYTGGQIQFDVEENINKMLIPMVQGSVVLFPSFQVYRNQVVSSGSFFTISGCVRGNSFC